MAGVPPSMDEQCHVLADAAEQQRVETSDPLFIALLAHEIRTPLTSVRALLEVLRRQASRGERVGEEVFARLDEQVEVITALAGDLSDAAILQAGHQIALALEPLDLVPLVRDVAGGRLARRGRLGEKVRYDVVLPDEALMMAGDHGRLSRVVQQLLDNASKFMPRGGVVEVRVEGRGDHHLLLVKDSGIGVSPQDLPHVTDPYFRGSNIDAEHYPGIGLGLTLARAVVEQHGGTMSFESALHVGTTVEVCLPARRVVSAQAASDIDAEVSGSVTGR